MWLPDGNVRYLQGKRVTLAFMAVALYKCPCGRFQVDKEYEAQCLCLCPSRSHKYRYWTGLLVAAFSLYNKAYITKRTAVAYVHLHNH